MSQPTPRDIENLIEMFQASDWEEMHLKTGDLEIFLSHDPAASGPASAVVQAAPASGPVSAPAVTAAPPAAQAAAPASAASSAAVVPEGMVGVSAPNLGTFYRAPKPGAPPYVEVGQVVTPDSEVCLIEVMKLFTPVKAGVAGTVKEVCVSDGQMVEFEQLLVIIEPSA